MKARIKWVEHASFVAESGSGHALLLDGAPEHGGRNLGIRPMEAVLIGLGGCTAFDVVSILKKSRQAVTDCVVELSAERAEEAPKVFTRIHMTYRLSGHALGESQVRRAVSLSAEKYCSATAMLRQSVDITHDYVIEQEPESDSG
ncbi:MAG: OsmC family protein [Gammaproteobacteria bacterium]|nr:OsmC family protein [Gammaproteobacteria bacterium]